MKQSVAACRLQSGSGTLADTAGRGSGMGRCAMGLSFLRLAVVAAALYFVYDLKGALIGSIILAVTLVFLVVMAVVMRRALSPNGRLGKKGLTLHETSGKNDPNLEPNLVGSTGICRTTLRPSGYVQIQGQTYDAIATQGLIQKGAIVVVERVSANRLYVREAQ